MENIIILYGTWITKPPYKKIPTQMDRDDAAKYYTLKFREYWDSLK